MRLENYDLIPFLTWLPLALVFWLGVLVCVAVGVTVVAWLVAAVQERSRPRHADDGAGVDGRCGRPGANVAAARLAMARLAIQESIRRRVVAVFAVFILLMLFASWFLDPGSEDPGPPLPQLRAHRHQLPGSAVGVDH